MYKDRRAFQISLPVQMVVMSVGLVIIATSAIGIPSLYLIHNQLEQQAWVLVEQGRKTTHALVSASLENLQNLAIVTAQRPTLRQILQQNEQEQLAVYLQVLQQGSSLDLILLCDAQGNPIAQAGLPISTNACSTAGTTPFLLSPSGVTPPAWLLAAQPIRDIPARMWVIVGLAVDDDFLMKLRDQTGLEQMFLVNGLFLESSFPDGDLAWRTFNSLPGRNTQASENVSDRGFFTQQDTPMYAVRSRFDDLNIPIEMVVALPVSDLMQVQVQLTRMVGGGIAAVILASSILGAILAKRISLPLERLRDSATALRGGNLTTPVSIRTRVREINQVSYALEDARITLYHSLATLRKEKEWADQLLESVVEGIVTLDRYNRITFFSLGAERISGWKQEQVIGKSIDDVFCLQEKDTHLSSVLPAPGGKQTIVTVGCNSRQVTLAITGARLAPPEAGNMGTALVLRDVSDEEVIRRLLGNFLANITHEFRTPLTALAVSIDLLMDQLASLSQVELEELLDSLRLGILGLQTLIDNLLEGASIEAGRFRVHPQPTELRGIVGEVVRTMQPLMKKYGQRLGMQLPDELPLVWADPRRTGQVLVNLLSNAIKVGPAGSEITITVKVCGQEVQVLVSDQGPGIPPGQHKDIFSRFANTNISNDRVEHGAGLGLSVVKAVVEAQKGQVGVMDGAGGGAIFWFSVPISEGEV